MDWTRVGRLLPEERFVPDGFDPSDVSALEATAHALLHRPCPTPALLLRWLEDWSELSAAVWGEWIRRMVDMNIDTTNPTARSRSDDYQQRVSPAWQSLNDQLNRAFLAHPLHDALGPRLDVWVRQTRQAATIFRQANTQLSAREDTLRGAYQQLQGAVAVQLGGQRLTPQQARARLQGQDRAAREAAWRALWTRHAADTAEVDGIFDELVQVRHEMARNADFQDYVDYRFAASGRFDYTPEDCRRYADAVEAHVVPALARLAATRRARLQVDRLRPWDMAVSLFASAQPTLFADQPAFESLAHQVMTAIDPRFGADFDLLRRHGTLDLMSRPGKAPGGYNAPIYDRGLPFIFMNAVGTRRDLSVLLHEGGHALHTLATRHERLLSYRNPPSEFAEVASMSMELLGMEALRDTLPPDDFRAYAYEHLAGILGTFATVARVDSFQRWIYRNPDHDQADRTAAWARISRRFTVDIDRQGLGELLAAGWQPIPHLFTHPMYFIEYGIAQIGALQVWLAARRDREAAFTAYRHSLALGGSQPLPALFAAAGLRFSMEADTLSELVRAVEDEIRCLLD